MKKVIRMFVLLTCCTLLLAANNGFAQESVAEEGAVDSEAAIQEMNVSAVDTSAVSCQSVDSVIEDIKAGKYPDGEISVIPILGNIDDYTEDDYRNMVGEALNIPPESLQLSSNESLGGGSNCIPFFYGLKIFCVEPATCGEMSNQLWKTGTMYQMELCKDPNTGQYYMKIIKFGRQLLGCCEHGSKPGPQGDPVLLSD